MVASLDFFAPLSLRGRCAWARRASLARLLSAENFFPIPGDHPGFFRKRQIRLAVLETPAHHRDFVSCLDNVLGPAPAPQSGGRAEFSTPPDGFAVRVLDLDNEDRMGIEELELHYGSRHRGQGFLIS